MDPLDPPLTGTLLLYIFYHKSTNSVSMKGKNIISCLYKCTYWNNRVLGKASNHAMVHMHTVARGDALDQDLARHEFIEISMNGKGSNSIMMMTMMNIQSHMEKPSSVMEVMKKMNDTSPPVLIL